MKSGRFFSLLCLVLYNIFLAQCQEINLSAISKKMFTSSCTESQYSDWIGCIWPSRDLRHLLNRFFSDAKSKHCKTPSVGMMRTASEFLKNGNYMNNTLYSVLPNEACGFCGRKVRCCPTSKSFLAQSYASSYCDQTKSYCTLNALNDDQVAKLAVQYPTVSFNGDRCDFLQFAMAEYGRIQTSKAFPVVKQLLCQMYQSTQPKINCVNVNGSCRCCCMNYVYRDGNCVADENMAADTSCRN